MLEEKDETAITAQIAVCLKRLRVRVEFLFGHVTSVLQYRKVKCTSGLL